MAAAVGIISPQPDLTNTPDLSDTDSAWVNRTEMIGFKLQPQTGGFKRCEAFVLAPLRLFSWVLARCWLPTIPHSLAYQAPGEQPQRVLARCWLPTIPHSLAYPVLRRPQCRTQ